MRKPEVIEKEIEKLKDELDKSKKFYKNFKNEIYTLDELKSLNVGDSVLISFEDLNDDDESWLYEKSEVVMIEDNNIYFDNDYGMCDFDLTGKFYPLPSNGKCIKDTGDHILTIYKL